jgi:hypothetical protein
MDVKAAVHYALLMDVTERTTRCSLRVHPPILMDGRATVHHAVLMGVRESVHRPLLIDVAATVHC